MAVDRHGHTYPNRRMRRHMRLPLTLATVLALAGCAEDRTDTNLPDLPEGVQAISLLGDTLVPPPLSPELRAAHEQRLGMALEAYEADPNDADALIWYGRRTAYLGRYRQAIAIYTEGIRKHPDDARIYRHRGHRYITVRLFDLAVADLEHATDLIRGTADEVEPDGLPNVRNIPTSTLHFNIWYHLGLAYYLGGHFAEALEAYQECLQVSNNPDALVATSYWLYMTLRRLGRDDEAASVLEPITPTMDIIENHAYHRLLMLFQGRLSPEDLMNTTGSQDPALANATLGYGVGRWQAFQGRPDEAREVWRSVLAGSQWAAFGYAAAETELARSGAP